MALPPRLVFPPTQSAARQSTVPIVLVAGALGLTCVLCSNPFCGWREEPRKLDAPLKMGMSVLEVGKARPGDYTCPPRFGDLKPARDLHAGEMLRFTGDLLLRPPRGEIVRIPFENGRRSAFATPPSIDPELLKKLPRGTGFSDALTRLGPSVNARVEDIGLAMITFTLPQDAKRLAHYSGTLEGSEMAGWFHFYNWKLTFRDGRVVDVEETDWQD